MVPQPKGDLEVNLGSRFNQVRRAQKVFLRPLAEALGCSVNTIRWHERGARMLRADLIYRAAQVMGVDPGLLLSEQEYIKEGNAYEGA